MANLVKVIRKYGLTGTAQEVADALNAKTIPKTNSERQGLAELANHYGWAAVTNFQAKLVAGGKQGYLDMLASGADLSTQAAYDAAAEMVSSGILTYAEGQSLLSLGQWNESIWQDEGGENDVLVADVTTALAAITFEDNANDLAAQVDDKAYVIKAKLYDGDIVDWAGCVTEFGVE